MPAEERRLVAEEGSYSLKTWLLKTEDWEGLGELLFRAPVSPASLAPSCRFSTRSLGYFLGRAWLVGYLWIL